MNVLEYFDYEKQLLRDYEAVKTPHAKAAVFKTLMDTLDTHKEFVFNTISSFEENLKNARKDIQKAYNGQTPKYVTNMMAEFGFYEAEEDKDASVSGYIANVADLGTVIKDLEKTKRKRRSGEKPGGKKRRASGGKCEAAKAAEKEGSQA